MTNWTVASVIDWKEKKFLARENAPQQARRILNKTFNQGGEKLDISDKGSWLNQNFYQDKMAETTTKVLPEVDIDPKTNSDNDDDIYSDSSLPYIVVNSKLSEAALAKIARCHEVAPKCLWNSKHVLVTTCFCKMFGIMDIFSKKDQ